MSTITKEWLQQKIADTEAARDEIPFGLDEDDSNTLAAMRIALASLEAEPVCVIDQSNLDYLKSGSDADVWPASRTEMGDVLLYRSAPPAPVTLPDLKELEAILDWILMLPCPTPKATHFAKRLAVVIDTCRAAMLQGAEPVTTAYKLPANTPCKEAPEHIWLQTAGVWPENGEFSELTWCSDNQHEDDTLYVRADVVSGNSPVIPDGLCPCCGRKPLKHSKCSVPGCGRKHVAHGLCQRHYDMKRREDPKQVEKFREASRRFTARKRANKAAPQQEVK